MNPQFGLEQVVLSPKGKSQAHTDHATHALELRIVKDVKRLKLSVALWQVYIFGPPCRAWPARVILVRTLLAALSQEKVFSTMFTLCTLHFFPLKLCKRGKIKGRMVCKGSFF